MRIEQEEWQEWNMMLRMLVGVTLGHISQNMRRVALLREDGDWIVEVILEKDDPHDREEAEEFARELWIDSEDHAEGAVRARVIIDDGPSENFPKYEEFAGSVYWRKE